MTVTDFNGYCEAACIEKHYKLSFAVFVGGVKIVKCMMFAEFYIVVNEYKIPSFFHHFLYGDVDFLFLLLRLRGEIS